MQKVKRYGVPCFQYLIKALKQYKRDINIYLKITVFNIK